MCQQFGVAPTTHSHLTGVSLQSSIQIPLHYSRNFTMTQEKLRFFPSLLTLVLYLARRLISAGCKHAEVCVEVQDELEIRMTMSSSPVYFLHLNIVFQQSRVCYYCIREVLFPVCIHLAIFLKKRWNIANHLISLKLFFNFMSTLFFSGSLLDFPC